MKRRGFLGALAAMLGAPVVHPTRPEDLFPHADRGLVTPRWVVDEAAQRFANTIRIGPERVRLLRAHGSTITIRRGDEC